MNKALVVFVRSPRSGKVKTRLAGGIGDRKALEVYRWLLGQTLEEVAKVRAQVHIYLDVGDNELDLPDHFQKYLQKGKDLGERMYRAMDERFKEGAQGVVIIGSDLPDINSDRLEEAFKALEKDDMTVGPALDGGFYLLGLKEGSPTLFNDIPWSAANTFERLMENAGELKLSTHLLPTERDLDDEKDFLFFEKRFEQHVKNKDHVLSR